MNEISTDSKKAGRQPKNPPKGGMGMAVWPSVVFGAGQVGRSLVLRVARIYSQYSISTNHPSRPVCFMRGQSREIK